MVSVSLETEELAGDVLRATLWVWFLAGGPEADVESKVKLYETKFTGELDRSRDHANQWASEVFSRAPTSWPTYPVGHPRSAEPMRYESNEWRRWRSGILRRMRFAARRKCDRSPLMRLGDYLVHAFTTRDPMQAIETAPLELLEEAFGHVEARIRRSELLHNNARGRATRTWLLRWSYRIGGELRRRGTDRPALPVAPEHP